MLYFNYISAKTKKRNDSSESYPLLLSIPYKMASMWNDPPNTKMWETQLSGS